jgi:hypothetical protein
MNWINLYGLIIVVLILIPNIIYARKNNIFENKCKNKAANISEQIGRYASMFFMVFNIGLYEVGFQSNEHFTVWLISLVVLLLLYWLFWGLYFKKRTVFNALMLAIIPSSIFILHGIFISHWLLLIFGVVFSVGHIYVTYQNNKSEFI